MNTDFLKYDASSLEEYLKRKLIESGVFTDQVYPGSDTQLLINLFSWTFECLQYILNNNASDVLFYDSKVYENMNRLVKLLSYSPRAYTTSSAEFSITGEFDENLTCDCTIPKYSKIILGKNDSSGNQICYSFSDDFSFKIKNGHVIYVGNNPILYNGEFIRYRFEQTAVGTKYESFVMTGINNLVDNDSIKIFIEKTDERGILNYSEVKIVNSLVIDASYDDLVCEKRLNENKEFEFSFGDGIHGKILENGTHINVIYLKSNGNSGKIEPNEFKSDNLILNIKGFDDNDTFINMLYGGIENFKINYGLLFIKNNILSFKTNILKFLNLNKSSDVIDYENVDDIRHNAPESFRIGNRLITASDFRTYILNKYKNRIKDVYVCNNNEYCTNFYKWLNDYDELNVNIRLNNYEYANACDFNNIYIWLQPKLLKNSLNFDKKVIINDCNKIKSLTTTLIPCNGIKAFFVPFVMYNEFDKFEMINTILSKTYIPNIKIIVKRLDKYVSNDTIKSNICKIIINYFNENSKFGSSINLSEIYKQILSLGYIEYVKTINLDKNNNFSNYSNTINGLSFACFTNDLIGFKDFEVFTQMKILQKFQYPELLLDEKRLNSLIKIIDENSFTLKNDEI